MCVCACVWDQDLADMVTSGGLDLVIVEAQLLDGSSNDFEQLVGVVMGWFGASKPAFLSSAAPLLPSAELLAALGAVPAEADGEAEPAVEEA